MTNVPNAQEGFWIGMHADAGLCVVTLLLWHCSWKEKNFCSGEHLCSWGLGRSLQMRTFNVLSFPSSPTDGGRESPFPVQSLQATAVVFPFNYLYMKDCCILQHLSFLRQFAAAALQSFGKALYAATARQRNLG